MTNTTKSATSLALMGAVSLPDGDGVPDWLHLLPTEGAVRTNDGRGPYKVTDIAGIIEASLQAGAKLVLDENHSTDLAAPKGKEAPARGWIVELQRRTDGVWGRVEWTKRGREMIADREYRGVSPVIAHRKDGTIVAIRRASLVNEPNFVELTALHQQDHQEKPSMTFMEQLAKALGLGESASEEDILAALKKALAEPEGDIDAVEKAVKEAAQSTISPIAKDLGLDEGADLVAIQSAIGALKTGSDKAGEIVTAMQSRLDALETDRKKDTATAFVDGAIREGRAGLKPQRDEYIAMHMENPDRAKKLIGALPKVGGPVNFEQDVIEELDDPVQLAAQATAYQKKLADEGTEIDFGSAVTAVTEGKHK
ncbi:hypothetical protein IT881_15180 [Erythrobacter sp. A30-3]|nr:hypothetical protein IT881_15180 [Erythrobacter sp. A30-3]